jgi:L,D-transpeptidase catalytic domain
MKRIYILFALLALVVLAYVFRPYVWAAISPVAMKFTKAKTVAGRLNQFGEAARGRWKPYFNKAQTAYPPAGVKLVALKTERILQVYAVDKSGRSHWIRSYPILAASGIPGPKLQEGDGQVPEGVYPIESLNPNSRFHVALRVGYPNAFDRSQAEKDGRTKLGGDIMIHGSSVSVGCLAMGDETAEDLFVLAADAGLPNITVIIAPVDFRTGKSVPKPVKLPDWSDMLYSQIKVQLAGLAPEASR